MGILIVLVAVFGIYSAGLAPDIHVTRETVRHEPAAQDEEGFLPSRLLDCRAHGSRALYRDLSRPPRARCGWRGACRDLRGALCAGLTA